MLPVPFFIGIVPPDDVKRRIEAFRNRWESNRLREVVEPHITVKAQSGLTGDLAWLDKVRNVCSSFRSFRVSLGEPATYGTSVAYLSVRSAEICELHRSLMEAVSPPPELLKIYYELDRYHPHLTLGQTHWGMSESEIVEMAAEARRALAPYPSFDVAFVRVYKEIGPDRYAPFEDIRLAR